LVVGQAIGGNPNIIPMIGVFATIRKVSGLPLSLLGGPLFIFEAADAGVLAHSFERAATNIASIRHSRTNGYSRHHNA